jgi:hypothetical protein
MFKVADLLQRIKIERIRALGRGFEQTISTWNQASKDSSRKYGRSYITTSTCICQLLNPGSSAPTRTTPEAMPVGWTATPSTRPN